jgi:hypothetical protein
VRLRFEGSLKISFITKRALPWLAVLEAASVAVRLRFGGSLKIPFTALDAPLAHSFPGKCRTVSLLSDGVDGPVRPLSVALLCHGVR